jgi:hypothetical protein
LIEAIRRFPGAVIRFPSVAVDTLDAVNALAERIDRLLTVLEPLQGSVNLAGTGVDFATTGFAQAITGIQQAVGALDSSFPPFASPSATLRSLAGRLGGTTVELVVEQEEPPAKEWERDDLPPIQLDMILMELVRLVESVVGTIPGIRQFLGIDTTRSSDSEDD